MKTLPGPCALLFLASKSEFAKLLGHFVTCLDLGLCKLSRLFGEMYRQSLKFGYCLLCPVGLSFEQAF